MTVTTPFVNGTSYCTVTAYSVQSYKAAIDFYTKFLSLENRSSPDENSTLLSNDSISLKILLRPDEKINKNVEAHLKELNSITKTKTGDHMPPNPWYLTLPTSWQSRTL